MAGVTRYRIHLAAASKYRIRYSISSVTNNPRHVCDAVGGQRAFCVETSGPGGEMENLPLKNSSTPISGLL